MKVAIIGGGAAGFFSAIHVKENYPDSQVIILEKSQKLLSKVKISGGGRCNVTNACPDLLTLSKAYPRGSRALLRAFYTFNNKHTIDWFENRGVPLVVQDDNCVFPASQNSQSITDIFEDECKRLGILIKTGTRVIFLKQIDEAIELGLQSESKSSEIFDKVIVATGGSPKRKGLEWLEKLGHRIVEPVPSLFTFNMPSESIRNLMGIVVEKAIVSIQGTKLHADGPILITHWGMSGPAILKLSAIAARALFQKDYKFIAQVNWINNKNNDQVLSSLQSLAQSNPNKSLANKRAFSLPERLWLYLLEKSDFNTTMKWAEVGKKGFNKLVTVLTNDQYAVKGKTTFKDEFVTCGGISLDSVDFKTMQSKYIKNLYFAGEILDIDGITGGYNFQAAWTTGFIAGKLLD